MVRLSKWIAGFFSLLVVTLGSIGNCFAQDRVDAVGDPLPKSAQMRLGSLRFSSPDGVMELILSKDQTTLVSFGNLIIGWDVQTGRELWRHRSPLGYLPACYGNRAVTLAPDGEHFLLADYTAKRVTKWNMRTGDYSLTEIRCVGDVGGAARSIDVTAGGQLTFVGNSRGYSVYDAMNQVVYKDDTVCEELAINEDRLAFGGGFAYGRFSPDASLIAIVTSNSPKEIQLLKTSTGEKIGNLTCEANVVRMEFSPDGNRLAVTERDTAVRLYDCMERKRVWQCVFEVDKRSENYTSALTFSPDGAYLMVCERNETIFKVEVATGKQVGSIRNHSWNPWAVTYTADGRRLFSSGWGGTIHEWDAESLDAIPLPKGYRGTDAVTLSSDGTKSAVVDQAGRVHVVSRPSGNEVATLSVPGGLFGVVEFSWDGASIVAGGSWGGQVHVIEWEIATSQIRNHWQWDVGDDPVTDVQDIVFSSDDERMIVSVFRQDAAYLLNRATQERVKLPHNQVYGSSFSPNGNEIYSVGWDKMLRVWDGMSGKLLSEKLLPTEVKDARMYTVCADPRGKALATCRIDPSIGIYDVVTHELILEWKTGSGFVFGSLRYSPDGLWLASGHSSGEIKIWDAATGEELHKLGAHDNHVYTIDFGKDNRTICSGGSNIGYVWSLRPTSLNCIDNEDALKKLCGGKGVDAYHAWWHLLEQGDWTVNALQDLCGKVTNIIDVEGLVFKAAANQRASRRDLLLKAAGKSDTISLASATRIVSVIYHIDTPIARKALKELAERNDELGQIAATQIAEAR